MKSTLVSKENNIVKLSLEFTAEEFEKEVNKVYQKNRGQFRIDGFRKGKAPRSIIERMYGATVFYDEAINELIGDAYPAAIKELDLEVIDYPAIEDMKIEKGEPVVVDMKVEVYPEVVAKDYLGVEIEKVDATVTDEDVDREIESLQKRNSRMVLVDREIQDGDTVLLDYAGFVGEEQFEGGTAERYPLKIGSGTFIPGFEEQLKGAKAGEDVEVKVTFPEEYHSDDLAGKEAVFKCTIHEVKEEELPEIDDEFVKDVSEFDTLEELKADTRANLEKKAAEEAKNEMENKVIEAIYDANDITVPNAMVESELDQTMNSFAQQLQVQGLQLEEYLKYMGQTTEDFRATVKDDAERKVKTRMLLQAIAEQEAIEVAEAEIDAELEKMAAQYNMELEQIKSVMGEENLGFLSKDIKLQKAMDLVYEKAVIK